ncbi:methyl-accepting chemotaxis protein [Thiomicrorhabdus sp. ZW0627]|uniref:methyl-accepting chemotaxis protein n=1 Tax=Thiomicrorhabdus sp. ZW0627 TaxID=3039774 RepID=UPI0024363C81|nr:methyl-accepting chemotaxis protein [Thiomicrorhabdus sp. ZW0627]MDG6772843.1 methyl-accepting chemotaxis protein [Thiomicrorhabdus sp. ZW0627]
MYKNKKMNSIRIKSSIPTVTLAISMIVLLVVAYWMLKMQERSIKLQADKFIHSISLTLNADRDLYQAKVAELNLLANYGSAEKNEGSRIENAQQVSDRYAKYMEHMKDYPDVLAKSDGFKSDFEAWKNQSDKLVAAIGQADEAEIMALRRDEEKKFSALRDNLDVAGEAALLKSVEMRERLEEQLTQFKTIAIVILGLILLGALWIGYSIPKNISRQLQKTIDAANAIAAGDLSNTIETNTTDETGQLLNSMKRMQDTIKLLLHDMNRMSEEHDAGDIDVVVDESKFQGDYKKMAAAINAMVSDHISMNKKSMAVFKSFGNGDFDADMEKLPGKKAFINESIETVRSNLKAITADTDMLIQAVADGELDKLANSDKFQGDWKRMIEGVNQILAGMVKPLNEAIGVLVEIEQGNLTKTVTGDYKGQLGEFKQTVNNTVAKLSSVINQTVQASQIVSQGAQEVAQGAMDLSSRVQEQAAAIEQTSATMEEITSSVQHNAHHAKDASDVVRTVQRQSNTGSKVMGQTIEAMNAIQESSHKISDIVTLIDGIAFQTNLLALNAAVEAARAGEHGRGFAVVASEVRSLSQKSADAAREITTLISESVDRIDQGTKLASESSEVLSAINKSIDDVVEVVEQIELASSQQMEGIEQVHKAVGQIDGVTQQNAALIEETAAAADSMSEQAERLNRDMAFFRIQSTEAEVKQLPV